MRNTHSCSLSNEGTVSQQRSSAQLHGVSGTDPYAPQTKKDAKSGSQNGSFKNHPLTWLIIRKKHLIYFPIARCEYGILSTATDLPQITPDPQILALQPPLCRWQVGRSRANKTSRLTISWQSLSSWWVPGGEPLGWERI